MKVTCSQCGANLTPGETCQDRFNAGQLKELELPSYGAVHHLSVPCYMLQHNAYSREGWLTVRELLFQFIYRGLTPAMARQHNRVNFDSRHRTCSLTKGAMLPGVEEVAWAWTIADVRLDAAKLYCADVRHWTESILADSEQLVHDQSLHSGSAGHDSARGAR
jgi:hypothetical protein